MSRARKFGRDAGAAPHRVGSGLDRSLQARYLSILGSFLVDLWLID